MLTNMRVIAHELLGDDVNIRRLVLEGEAAAEAQPGQFLHIRAADALDPLLRRPLSIAAIDRSQRRLTVLYRIKGRGTQVLAAAPVGGMLDVLGPLGRGFQVPSTGELILAAGGIGVFPLLALAAAAAERQVKTTLFWGGEDRAFFDNAGLRLWRDLGTPLSLATMDGSLGRKGLVTELLGLWWQERTAAKEPVSMAACGPAGMLKAVSLWAQTKAVSLEVSLEERMACGLGACLGCACQGRDSEGRLKNLKVCTDGPVFKAEEVEWDAG